MRRELGDAVHPAAPALAVVQGRVGVSLYASLIGAGAPLEVTAEAARLFAHRLDLSRDLRRGDEFRLVFERSQRKIPSSHAGELLMAEVAAAGRIERFYRFDRLGGDSAFLDERGAGARGQLLTTPVDGARVSSSFGLRRHPILGFTRQHQGVDFAAASGAPVLAAGEGVVVEAGRNGGYGQWVKLRHAGGLETGYAHLSRVGTAVRPGRRVAQGEVIGYVGSTGVSTGPHLHFEVWRGGRRVDPKAVRAPQPALGGREMRLFARQRDAIDRLVADAPGAAETPRLALADFQRGAGAEATVPLRLRRGG